MKKIIAILMAALLLLGLCACGEKDEKPADPSEVKGETYDAGEVSALVPEGWKAFPVTDLFDEYDGDYDPTAIQIAKGAESEWDLFTVPYIQINYYGPDSWGMMMDSSFYDETEDLEPMTLGSYKWTGFNVIDEEYPQTILWAEDGDIQIQVMMNLGTGKDAISVSDPEVQAIVASITPVQ